MAQSADAFGQYPERVSLSHNPARDASERLVQTLLLLAALTSVLVTIGIIISLIGETIVFFSQVSFADFFGSFEWFPGEEEDAAFGIWPLLNGTLLIAGIALLIAIPLGLTAAVFLSEFASPRVRAVCKPLLELLAGVPTVVYGFFALSFITPFLQRFLPNLQIFNALSAGIAVGVLIIPIVSSLSEDALQAVPSSLREGAYGLGATRFEVATRVVFPAALSGIVAAIILALSIAIGETMIVTIAANGFALLTADPRNPVQTMTSYIAQVSGGDTRVGSLEYNALFAVGATLFVITLTLNIISNWFVRRFRQVYD